MDRKSIFGKYTDISRSYNFLNRIRIDGNINECNRYVKHCNDIVAPRINAGTCKSPEIDSRVGAWLNGGGSG